MDNRNITWLINSFAGFSFVQLALWPRVHIFHVSYSIIMGSSNELNKKFVSLLIHLSVEEPDGLLNDL